VLGETGQLKESLSLAEEAVELWEKSSAGVLLLHRSDYALALSNLSNRQGSLSRHEEAIAEQRS
jgi:hypothetical protein